MIVWPVVLNSSLINFKGFGLKCLGVFADSSLLVMPKVDCFGLFDRCLRSGKSFNL